MSKKAKKSAPITDRATARDAVLSTIAATLPEERDRLLAEATEAIAAGHAAVIASDTAGVSAATDRYEAIIWKLNGGTLFGSAADHVRRHCRAERGRVPLWGQEGEFLIQAEGVRAVATCSGGFDSLVKPLFAFEIVDLDRPFISPTGYQSHFVSRSCFGMTVAESATNAFTGHVRQSGLVMLDAKTRNQLANTARPAWLAAMRPRPCRSPAAAAVPPGFVLVDVVLPAHQAFIARRWAEHAQAKLVAMNAKKKR